VERRTLCAACRIQHGTTKNFHQCIGQRCHTQIQKPRAIGPRLRPTLSSTTHDRESIFFSAQFSYPFPLCDTTLNHSLHLCGPNVLLILPDLVAASPSSMIPNIVRPLREATSHDDAFTTRHLLVGITTRSRVDGM
jgi:hypothetical protein